jgi:hypothetical protein
VEAIELRRFLHTGHLFLLTASDMLGPEFGQRPRRAGSRYGWRTFEPAGIVRSSRGADMARIQPRTTASETDAVSLIARPKRLR